ncbi:MAG TPA: hypothetical protein VL147_01720 [Devosia sp.]|nr:hypothetical protein [Devosia sp.]
MIVSVDDKYRKEETEVTHGFAIVDSRGRVWSDMIFTDADGANMTAARCCTTDCTIVAAREIKWQDYRPGFKLPRPMRQIVLDGEEVSRA